MLAEMTKASNALLGRFVDIVGDCRNHPFSCMLRAEARSMKHQPQMKSTDVKRKCKETLRNRVLKKKLGFHPLLNMSDEIYPEN